MSSDGPQNGNAADNEYFICSASESEARVRRILPEEGSEDVSHLLKPPAIADASASDSKRPRDYLPNPQVDWVVRVDFEGDPVLTRSDILSVLSPEWMQKSHRPTLYGYSPSDECWTVVQARDAGEAYTRLQFAWRLYSTCADEGMPMDASTLSRAAKSVGKACRELGKPTLALEMSPEEGETRASDLSELVEACDQDVLILLRAPDDKAFDGRDIWDVMLCLGLRWGDGDLFHWPNPGDTGDDAFFSVETSTPPGYFFPEEIAAGMVHTEDLVFGYSVLRSAAPAAILGQMLQAARYAQQRLGGELLDATEEALNEVEMLDEINAVEAHLTQAGFAPGSESALQLF